MSNKPQFPLEPLHYFSRIAKLLTRVGDARLRPLGFATAHLPVLAGLQDGQRRSQAELVKLAGVEQPSMAQLLARMDRDGIVRRTPDPKDRRSSLVALTERAREDVPAGREVLRRSNAELVRGFSPDEVKTLNGFLQRILENAEAMEQGSRRSEEGEERHAD